MARTLVWDLPIRLFHWLLAGGFMVAAFIALALDEHGPLFPYHAIIGLTLAVLVGLRLIWGLVGSRYARFGASTFSPIAVVEYAKGVLTGRSRQHIGHNPGSAYAMLAILAMVLGLAITGVMMGLGNEGAEELHDVLAYSMLAVVCAHLLGVIVHTIRHRENITGSMIHGRKTADESASIRSAHPFVAIVFLLISGTWAASLLASYDTSTQTITVPAIGMSLQLGEAEGNEKHKTHGHEEHDEDDGD